MAVEYRSGRVPSTSELRALYDDVGWTAYTADDDLLRAAVAASLRVVTAWDGPRLAGLARVVGDGLTIAYLQDILVDREHRRLGIGRELFRRVFEPFSAVRQQVLMTDAEPGQRAFYESMGFTEVRDMPGAPLRVFARLG